MMITGWRWAGAAVLTLWSAGAQAQEAMAWTLHEAVGAPGRLKLSGSFRARYEALDGQFRPGLDEQDDILALRTTLFAEYDSGPVRIGGELIDARVYGADAGSSVGANDVNAIELSQVYIAADLGQTTGRGSIASLTAGRFTMDLGSRRLVARNQFRNAVNAFTGLRFDRTGRGKDSLTLFAMLPHMRLPAEKEAILDNEVEPDRESFDLLLWGGFHSRPSLIGGLNAELYYYGLDEDDGRTRPTRDRNLHTPGLRLFSEPKAGRADIELEAVYQFGDIRMSAAADATRQDVSAHFLHAEVGYTWRRRWQPRLAFEFDWATGDRPGGSYGRFDSLFGVRRPDLNPAGIYGPLGRFNLITPGLRLEVKPDARWDGFVSYRAAWLDSRADFFSATGVRDAAGRSGRFAGHQVEARVRHWLVPKLLRLDTGAAVLLTGRFLEQAPNATGNGATHYGYLEVTATF